MTDDSPRDASGDSTADSPGGPAGIIGRRIGRYVVESLLGEGGMGRVLGARDGDLDRSVAIKTLHVGADEESRQRLRREARVLASVNHPNVCQVYAIEEQGGELFLIMERLDGESLAGRLARGALRPEDGVDVTLGVLAALQALHERGIVHRDLKPSNVFLTPHGVKLLDFGLARPKVTTTDPSLTSAGLLLGTPRYVAPEQWTGAAATPATDLFATAAILFEMLAGRPAFPGNNIAEIAHRVMEESPPALAGSPGVAAVDRVVTRSLSKRAEARHASATAMADDLRDARRQLMGGGEPPHVRALTRLIVLPFRVLRPDPDIDFLSYSLADAITTSLSALESVVLRSSATASRWAGGDPDLARVATEADVDAVLLGTLLRAGDQVRLGAQLVEAPSGTVISSATSQASLDDIFQLQDTLTRQVVEALALPLSTRERSQLGHDVPATARAYEFYLRANELARKHESLTLARDLYRSCLAEDPRFAPAWARLGRAYRVMAKYGWDPGPDTMPRAGEAFDRALALSPDLALAHNLYTPYELEQLGRPLAALERLLRRAAGNGSDPELFAGLVTASRYCGLLDVSVAADARARRLDPTIPTSVAYTHVLRGDPEAALSAPDPDAYVRVYALTWMERDEDAIREVDASLSRPQGQFGSAVLRGLRAALVQDAPSFHEHMRHGPSGELRDPEGFLYEIRSMARLGDRERALEGIATIVGAGFYCPRALPIDPWLASLRSEPAFILAVETMAARSAEAARLYERAGGPAILGVPAG